jgi:hypothetical protein
MSKRKKAPSQIKRKIQEAPDTISNVNSMPIHTFKDIGKLWLANIPFFFLLLPLIFIVFGRVIPGQFLTADDLPGIANNISVHDLWGTIKTFNITEVYISLLLTIFGNTAWVFHVSSILFHFVNTVLVFTLAYILFGKKTALLSALLFSIHPVISEAVIWISGVQYLVNGFIFLNVLIPYTMYKKEKKKGFLIYSIVAYTVGQALTMNPWLVTIPFVVIAYDMFVFEKQINFKNIKMYAPFFLAVVFFAYMLITSLYAKRLSDLQNKYYVNESTSTPIINRMPYTIYKTVELMLVPIKLSIYHDDIVISVAYYVLMIFMTLLLGVLTFWLYKRKSIFAGFIIMIFLTLMPIFSPEVIASLITERYLYMGTVLFVFMEALVLQRIEGGVTRNKLFYGVVVSILLLYGVRSFIRSGDFLSSKALWIETLRTDPNSYRVYNNLGDVYSQEGNYNLSVAYFKRSAQLNPTFADAFNNAGTVYLRMGDYEDAEQYFLQAYSLNPTLYEATFGIGQLEMQRNNISKAKDYFEKTLSINPSYQPAKDALAKIK